MYLDDNFSYKTLSTFFVRTGLKLLLPRAGWCLNQAMAVYKWRYLYFYTDFCPFSPFIQIIPLVWTGHDNYQLCNCHSLNMPLYPHCPYVWSLRQNIIRCSSRKFKFGQNSGQNKQWISKIFTETPTLASSRIKAMLGMLRWGKK